MTLTLSLLLAPIGAQRIRPHSAVGAYWYLTNYCHLTLVAPMGAQKICSQCTVQCNAIQRFDDFYIFSTEFAPVKSFAICGIGRGFTLCHARSVLNLAAAKGLIK